MLQTDISEQYISSLFRFNTPIRQLCHRAGEETKGSPPDDQGHFTDGAGHAQQRQMHPGISRACATQ